MSMPPHSWVVDSEGVAALAPRLAAAPWVALDTESNSYFVYRERVCLITLNLGDELVLVDPLALPTEGDPLGPLRATLEDPDKPLFLHGAEYDVACMKRDFDIALRGVYDTQQAASLLGFQRTGYGSVVADLLDVHLAKEHARFDWARRPIPPDALGYALSDVIYLPDVVERLFTIADEADIADEIAIACLAVEEAAAHDATFDPGRMYKLKGANTLGRSELDVLHAVFLWREEAAAAADRPPGRFVAHEALVALARAAPVDAAGLRSGRWPRPIRDDAEAIARRMAAALAAPQPLPKRPSQGRRTDGAEQARSQRLRAWRDAEAERRGVTTQVVLPGRALEHLAALGAAGLADTPQLGDKRLRLYGEALAGLLTP